ncbi:nth-like DNA glycosylase 1 isoform X2 [Lycorma delicatula]
MLVNCYQIIKMSSRSLKSKSVNNLKITEKYLFRGRRKLNDTTSDKDVTETKQIKLEAKLESESLDRVIENEKNLEVNVKSETDIDECKKKTASKSMNIKGKKTKKIKIDNPEESSKMGNVDIENCDELLDDKQKKVKVEKVKWVPENWEEVLKNIREMRKDQSAPVDDMGCHKTMDETASPKEKRYQALVSLMLSSQTKDQTTYATMLKLREHGLTVDNILNTDDESLANLINKVGFWRIKAKNIKRTTQILKDEYDGDIPDTVDKLLKLPGVGPKMAHLCMTTAWGKVHGIGVDTHVHRISNRLKWVPKQTSNPEQTRIALESWLPPKLWFEVNHLMVGFGQQICLPRNPKCETCLNKKICPTGKSELKHKNKKNKILAK